MLKKRSKSQVNISLSENELKLIQRAAQLDERSVASFVARAAWYSAIETILDKVPEYHGQLREEAQKQLGPEGERILLARYQQKQEQLRRFIEEMAQK